jgi:hypothetical protein
MTVQLMLTPAVLPLCDRDARLLTQRLEVNHALEET